MCYLLSLHSSVGHLGCVHLVWTVSHAAVNTGVQALVSVPAFSSLGYTPTVDCWIRWSFCVSYFLNISLLSGLLFQGQITQHLPWAFLLFTDTPLRDWGLTELTLQSCLFPGLLTSLTQAYFRTPAACCAFALPPRGLTLYTESPMYRF